MKIIHILFSGFLLAGCTAAQINQALSGVSGVLEEDKLTTADVANGLKEALINGTSKGSDQASKQDGYFKNPLLKIPFPPEVQKVEDRLRQLGMNKLVDDFVLSINRGAEKAAIEAKPIFIDAIKAMTIQDAWNILKGEDDAATQYLNRTTSPALYDKFKPVISTALQQVNATKYYTDVVTTYNKIPFVEKVNPDLEDYTTNKAISGLFLLIAQEEANIRKDPLARTTDLLKKVFAQQD
ncbi:MAG: DUF4197 domain-containing protein [Cyclobacteriaceae bacterium]|nr:DUF4197 domain-containing protein [Cyclobacteriaceae bacterium]